MFFFVFLGRDRELNFPSYYVFPNRRLIKRKINTTHAKDLDNCELLCYQHDNCVSINFKRDPDSATGQQECELNNSTHMENGEDLTTDNNYLYRGAKVRKSTFFIIFIKKKKKIFFIFDN